MVEDAQTEKDKILSEARDKVASIRGSMRRECESVSTYMASLMESVEGVVKACNETKVITDKAFGGMTTKERPALTDADTQEIPQIKFEG